MHDGKSPAFQLYVKEFLSDANQAGMSLQESGAYIRLMCFEWNEQGKGLPDDAVRCGNMIGATTGQMKTMWRALRSCFVSHPTEASRIVHPRLQKEREKQTVFKRRKSDAGKQGATKRWHNDSTAIAKSSQTDGTAMTEPMANDSSPISSLLSASKEQKHLQVPSQMPVDARSNRPIFTGQRIRVLEWQLEDLMQMLGPYVDSFGLDQWLDALDKRVVNLKLVLPKRDGGRWLQQQLLEEVRRRGLAIAGETEPEVQLPTAWECRTCGEWHEGPKAQRGQCLKGQKAS